MVIANTGKGASTYKVRCQFSLIMKNKLIKAALLSCVVSLMIACNPKKEELAAPVIDKEQIKLAVF